jgi:dCMP deaminase
LSSHDFINDNLDWHLLFLDYAEGVAAQSTCISSQVGAVIVQGGTQNIIGHGWNSVPPGDIPCLDQGFCYALEDKIIKECAHTLYPSRSIHAEINAIADCLERGNAHLIPDSVLYVTHESCTACLKSVIAHGIKQIFFCHSGKEAAVKSYWHQRGIVDLIQVSISDIEEEQVHE